MIIISSNLNRTVTFYFQKICFRMFFFIYLNSQIEITIIVAIL